MSRTFNLVRMFFVGCAVAALVASGVLLALGDGRGAAAAAVVAASALTFRGTSRTAFRSPRLTWLGFALLGGGLVILGFPIGMVVSGVAGLFILQVLANAFAAHRIRGITFERLDHSSVMPGAERLAQEFSVAGFTVIGGYRFFIGGKQVVLTVMIGPGRDRLAVVTDLVQYVVSRFGTRTLVTASSGLAPVPPDVLRQQIAGGSPTELVRAHDGALTVVSGRSLSPDMFATDDDALEAVRQHEEHAIEFIGGASLTAAVRIEARPDGAVLSDDPNHPNRLNRWLDA